MNIPNDTISKLVDAASQAQADSDAGARHEARVDAESRAAAERASDEEKARRVALGLDREDPKAATRSEAARRGAATRKANAEAAARANGQASLLAEPAAPLHRELLAELRRVLTEADREARDRGEAATAAWSAVAPLAANLKERGALPSPSDIVALLWKARPFAADLEPALEAAVRLVGVIAQVDSPPDTVAAVKAALFALLDTIGVRTVSTEATAAVHLASVAGTKVRARLLVIEAHARPPLAARARLLLWTLPDDMLAMPVAEVWP